MPNRHNYVDKRVAIFSWLKTSGFGKNLELGNGFFLEGTTNIKFLNGTERHLLTWLGEVGFCNGVVICGHQITLITSDISRVLDRLVFRILTISSPFDESGEHFEDSSSDEDDYEEIASTGHRIYY
jgi:hypothetical protein